MAEGDCLTFTLQYGDSYTDPPLPIDAAAVLQSTQQYWRDWIACFDRPTNWPEAVGVSAHAACLDLQAERRAGCRPTTSLPEKPGGTANWDYRYAWLRNSTFTISTLLNAGYHEEARRWRDWMLRAVAGTP